MRDTIVPQIAALINTPVSLGFVKASFYNKSVFLERNIVLHQANGQKRYVNGRKTMLSGLKPIVSGRKIKLSGRKPTVSGRKSNLQVQRYSSNNFYLEKKLFQRRLSVWESFF